MKQLSPEVLAKVIINNVSVSSGQLGLEPKSWRWFLKNKVGDRHTINVKEPLMFIYFLGENESLKQELFTELQKEWGIELDTKYSMPINNLPQYFVVTHANHDSETATSLLG